MLSPSLPCWRTAVGHAPPDGASGDRERGWRWRWSVRHLAASPAAGTSYLQCGPRDSDLGEPRRYASYEEWFAKSGSGSTVSSLIKHAPSQRSPTGCLTPRLPSKRDASAFDEQERAARGAKAAWTRDSHVSVARGALGLSSRRHSKARLVLSHAFDRVVHAEKERTLVLCTLWNRAQNSQAEREIGVVPGSVHTRSHDSVLCTLVAGVAWRKQKKAR